jgi:hypothetical protein
VCPDQEGKLRDLWKRLFGSNSAFSRLFKLDSDSQEVDLIQSQRQFIDLKLSTEYLLNKDDKLVYLDFIESRVFSLIILMIIRRVIPCGLLFAKAKADF